MQIKWNEVTWYSKLLAVIFFVGILPTLSFYIGMRCKEITRYEFAQPTLVSANSNIRSKSDWKIYQNTKYGFSFLYPLSSQIKENTSEDLKLVGEIKSSSREHPYINVEYGVSVMPKEKFSDFEIEISNDLKKLAKNYDAFKVDNAPVVKSDDEDQTGHSWSKTLKQKSLVGSVPVLHFLYLSPGGSGWNAYILTQDGLLVFWNNGIPDFSWFNAGAKLKTTDPVYDENKIKFFNKFERMINSFSFGDN